MQISENLLRVIFMLSTIVAVTDCCSSRLLLLKEHTLQIVQQHRLHHSQSADYDYEHEDYEQLQQQQRQQQQQQQQKIPQYVDITKSDIDFIKNYAEEHTRSRDKDDHEENNTETEILGAAMQLGNFGSDSFESLLGIFDAAAFDTTTTTTTTTTPTTKISTTSISSTIRHSTTPAATAAITKAQQSIYAENESSTTQRARAAAVVDDPQVMEASSTTITIPTTSTKASSAAADGVENVMNVRDLLSLPCSGQFNTEFCLNRGRCFRYPIGNDTIHSCICADGYIGERCESKSMNGSYIPSIAGAGKKQQIRMARIVFSFPMLLALSVIYIMVGAAIVFKRPVSPTHTNKERSELLPDDDNGELILMNSYPIVDQTVTYSTYAD